MSVVLQELVHSLPSQRGLDLSAKACIVLPFLQKGSDSLVFVVVRLYKGGILDWSMMGGHQGVCLCWSLKGCYLASGAHPFLVEGSWFALAQSLVCVSDPKQNARIVPKSIQLLCFLHRLKVDAFSMPCSLAVLQCSQTKSLDSQ